MLTPDFTGGTKAAELRRSADLFEEIAARDEGGAYYALMLLLDSGYDRGEMRKIADIMLARLRAR